MKKKQFQIITCSNLVKKYLLRCIFLALMVLTSHAEGVQTAAGENGGTTGWQ
jgi:hypothetical protein